MALSKEEVENIRHESKKAEHKPKIEAKPRNKKIAYISAFSAIFILAIAVFGYNFFQSKKPGYLDGFAQCLTEKGAVMYGASFCKYTHGQKGMFGNSVNFLDIRDFTEDQNVRVTPTWKINGEYYENVQSLDRLSLVTGCAIRR